MLANTDLPSLHLFWRVRKHNSRLLPPSTCRKIAGVRETRDRERTVPLGTTHASAPHVADDNRSQKPLRLSADNVAVAGARTRQIRAFA